MMQVKKQQLEWEVEQWTGQTGKGVWQGYKLSLCLFNSKQDTCGSAGKESACNVGALGSIPGLGTSPGEGKGYPLQ